LAQRFSVHLSNGMHPKTTVSLEKIVHDSGCPTRTLPNYDRKQRRNLAILLRRIRKMTKIHQKTPKSTIFDAPTSKASTHDSGEDLPYFAHTFSIRLINFTTSLVLFAASCLI